MTEAMQFLCWVSTHSCTSGWRSRAKQVCGFPSAQNSPFPLHVGPEGSSVLRPQPRCTGALEGRDGWILPVTPLTCQLHQLGLGLCSGADSPSFGEENGVQANAEQFP